ncbi:uncharacterized, partial [Tachysurus ichikawai]
EPQKFDPTFKGPVHNSIDPRAESFPQRQRRRHPETSAARFPPRPAGVDKSEAAVCFLTAGDVITDPLQTVQHIYSDFSPRH